MMRYLTVICMFTFFLPVTCEELELKVTGKSPMGTIFYATETFEFAWTVSQDGKIISQNSIGDMFQSFSIFIVEVKGQTRIIKVPSQTSTFAWEIPDSTENTIFLIHVDATPKSKNVSRLRGSTLVYVSPAKTNLKLPQDFNSHLVVLMDWNGKRGYYPKVDSSSALKYAQQTCASLRKNFSPDSYAEYLNIIEDIEFKETALLTIYCPIKRSKLYLDDIPMGFFEEWDEKEKLYYLEFLLPVSTDKPYTIKVSKDNLVYKNVQLHPSATKHFVARLAKEIEVEITSELAFRIISPKNRTSWGATHKMFCVQNEIEKWELEIKDAYKTKVYFVPSQKINFKLVQEENDYYLITPTNKHLLANGRTLNLIDFEK